MRIGRIYGTVFCMASATEKPATWDFFISYTQADRAWAEWIAWELEEAGHRVLVQAWAFIPGTNWIAGMQAGVAGAARTVAVLSSAYLSSEYGSAEWEAAWATDPSGKGRNLLVVRVEDCERRGLLNGVVGVDLFGRSEAEARRRLRTMATSALTGPGRPETPPAFPGAPGSASGPSSDPGSSGPGPGRAVPRRPASPEPCLPYGRPHPATRTSRAAQRT